MALWRRVNEAAPDEARALLQRCCGSSRWVGSMLARRPFASEQAMVTAAREEWFALAPADWLEAFSHHPKIGDRQSLRERFPATHALSAREQAGVDGAPGNVLDALATANRNYEQKFGFIFIVCASGKRADEMLKILYSRLGNDRDTELGVAAEEQMKITELRLRS